MYVTTTALRKLISLDKRIHGIQGGTSASKTISILQILIDKAQREYTKSKTISITSESVPHLKRGAMRDFKNILQEHNYWKDSLWNATDFIYTTEAGNKIEFFSLDQPHKVRGPRRDILFINEANNIPYETFDQLEVRTNEEIWLDWNPVAPFWWHEGTEDYSAVGNREDSDELILTYKDNEGLPASIVKSIETRKDNKAWWRVYGEGLIGEVKGRIYTDWEVIDEIPHQARLERRGLDFGYTNDPSAIVDIYAYNGGYILDEQLYRTGMSNRELSQFIKNLRPTLVIADSAEPKSIDEIRSYGINILPCTKGQGSVLQGIQFVQDQRISVTKRSINLLKEYRGYLWLTDKEGRTINAPIPFNDHLMAATRYGLTSLSTGNYFDPSQFVDQKVFNKYGIPTIG